MQDEPSKLQFPNTELRTVDANSPILVTPPALEETRENVPKILAFLTTVLSSTKLEVQLWSMVVVAYSLNFSVNTVLSVPGKLFSRVIFR